MTETMFVNRTKCGPMRRAYAGDCEFRFMSSMTLATQIKPRICDATTGGCSSSSDGALMTTLPFTVCRVDGVCFRPDGWNSERRESFNVF